MRHNERKFFMKMKKITALVCVMIMTVCLLAGCGNTSQTLAPQETGTPAATATPVPTPTPVPTVPPNAEVSDVSAICSSAGITTGAQGARRSPDENMPYRAWHIYYICVI